MVTHWESSRRPLYVRTVWKDGQHHVILDKTKERPSDDVQTIRKEKPGSSVRGTKNGCLKVSSFRSDVDTARVDRPKARARTVSGRQLTFRSLDKEINLNSVQGKPPPNLLPRSNTLERCSEEKTDNKSGEDSLSERVMIWLDLAAQHGQEFVPTVQPCRLIDKYQWPEDEAKTMTNDSFSILDKSNRGQFGAPEEFIIRSESELTSHVEEASCYEEIRVSSTSRCETTKRQLHIFIPNVSKRYGECESVLSSIV